MFTLPSSRWDCITMRDFAARDGEDRKSTRLNSSHSQISYAVFCLKKKNTVMMVPVLILAALTCVGGLLLINAGFHHGWKLMDYLLAPTLGPLRWGVLDL